MGQWHATAGWHTWTEPTSEQRYEAIRANAADRKAKAEPHDFCSGCAIECLCDTSKYEAMSDAELDAIAALDVNLADDPSIDRARTTAPDMPMDPFEAADDAGRRWE
jgi:hypothetical protein